MTSELRPEFDIAADISTACGAKHVTPRAIAIIKADREAVRAEQAAEIERLRERLEIDPAHSIDGIHARDETIRGLDTKILKLKARDIGWSMQFEEQAEELAKFKALAETLAGALGEIAQPDYGYTDILERGCPPEKHIDYFCSMVTWRQRTAREALTSYKEARDAS